MGSTIESRAHSCAGYLAYPFQDQEVNSYTGNLDAAYFFINCKEKEPVEPSFTFFFGMDMLSSQHRETIGVIMRQYDLCPCAVCAFQLLQSSRPQWHAGRWSRPRREYPR